MNKTKIRWWLFFITITAFFLPFGAIIAIERSKQTDKLAENERQYLIAQQAADQTRLEYLQKIEQRKQELKQSMDNAKNQYEELLQKQPSIISEHQKTVTQTTMQPVVTKQAIPTSKQSATSSKTAVKKEAAKPKTTTKTKTS